tara:strand:+ start:940 stop:1452 length:513 start_codon:yes stop_codon:yes gene_type:complete
MARQIINRGATGNDGTGDDLYTGAGKINDNFEELYNAVQDIETIVGTDSAVNLGVSLTTSSVVWEGATADSHETTLSVIDPTTDRTINLPDSSGTVALKHNIPDTIDSDYVQSKAVELDLRNYSVATAPTGSHGKMIFTTDGDSGSPCLAIFDSAAGFYKRIALGGAIST